MSYYMLTKVAGNVELPVSVENCKLDLKIQHNADDTLLEDYIAAAAALVGGKSGIVGKVLTAESWDLKLSSASGCVVLPLSPVQSIVSINYFDVDNQAQTLDVANFYLYGDEDSALIEPKTGVVWPAVYARRDAITIRFVAGFGTAADIPKNITRAIRLIVAHWYENRTAVLVGVTAQELPMAVESLLGISRKGWSA